MGIFRSCGASEELRTQFNALRAQVAAQRATLVALTAQLDADAGISDTDYADLDPAADASEDLTEF